MNNFKERILPLMDFLLCPPLYPAAFLFKIIRKVGVHKMPLCKKMFMNIGMLPIRNHYYEPLFDSKYLRKPLSDIRNLPGINLNIEEQLALLGVFNFSNELEQIRHKNQKGLCFDFNNPFFGGGDAEFLYNVIRVKKPKRVFEIGSGNSTLIAMQANKMNTIDNPAMTCKHICIEPYEMPWLDKIGVNIVRRKVEDLDTTFFSELEAGDLLFIDSSHIIRTQGDVLFEYLEILPLLKSGVIVHIHDICTPRDYLQKWVIDEVRLWNEQYLLEAFLTCNKEWKIIGALNYLHHNYYDIVSKVCPYMIKEREPVSFYIQKIA